MFLSFCSFSHFVSVVILLLPGPIHSNHHRLSSFPSSFPVV
jgi:hypothetical protein